MRRFRLKKGTAVVAEGCQFDSGVCVVSLLDKMWPITIYENIAMMLSQNFNVIREWIDDE